MIDIKMYDDIINLPHHVSSKHPHMSREGRAAQFAPFAALTGFGEAIDETESEFTESGIYDTKYYDEPDL